jgi:hypothetical protein
MRHRIIEVQVSGGLWRVILRNAQDKFDESQIELQNLATKLSSLIPARTYRSVRAGIKLSSVNRDLVISITAAVTAIHTRTI